MSIIDKLVKIYLDKKGYNIIKKGYCPVSHNALNQAISAIDEAHMYHVRQWHGKDYDDAMVKIQSDLIEAKYRLDYYNHRLE